MDIRYLPNILGILSHCFTPFGQLPCSKGFTCHKGEALLYEGLLHCSTVNYENVTSHLYSSYKWEA
jgi:hypothetical protein